MAILYKNNLMPTTCEFFNFSQGTMGVVNDKTGLTHEEEFCAEMTEPSMLSYMGAHTCLDALNNAQACAQNGFTDIIILRSVVCKNINYYVLCRRPQSEAE